MSSGTSFALGDLGDASSAADYSPASFRPIDLAADFRLTPRADRPAELVVAAACDRARADSIERLRAGFGGFRFDVLAQSADANVASVLSVDPAFLDQLDGMGIVERTLAHHDLSSPDLSFAAGGNTGHQDAPERVLLRPDAARFSRVRMPSLVTTLAEGWSAIVNAIDQYGDPVLAGLCTDLERIFGTRVQVNTYISHLGAEGFGAHWDDHDVIILQLHGRKYWEIHEPTHLSMLNAYTPSAVSGKVAWSGILEPGTALFVPRGWGHRVAGFDELSVHFTIGMRRMNGLDLLARLASLAPTRMALRGDLPAEIAQWFRSADGDSPSPASHLSSMATPEMVEAGWTVWRAQLLPRTSGALLATFAALHDGLADVSVQGAFPGGVGFADVPTDPLPAGQSWLAACGLLLRIDHRLGDAFAALVSGSPVRVSTLPGRGAGPDAVDQLVRTLLEAGWIQVVEDPG